VKAVIDIQSYISPRIELINQTLNSLVREMPSTLHGELFQAARYSLLSGGKRLRPLLTLATSEIYDVPIEKVLYPACALEMVHTYSLIHDDLPCMDNDDLRRGKPTLHKVYPEGHAVLTGDFLLTYAFEVLSISPHLTEKQKIDLVRCMAIHSGAQGMIGGQVVDLSSTGTTISEETLLFIHLCKTASMIIASLEFGGIIAEAPEEDRTLLTSVGQKLGIAFQIIDDILDVTGSKEDLGKKPGSDRLNDKTTAVTLFGLEKAQKEAEELFSSAMHSLTHLSGSSAALQLLAQSLVFRNK
jgi:geranylgeranyl diphosphate synthase, type II